METETKDLVTLNFTLNGEVRTLRVNPSLTLLELLRNDLMLRGTKEGCGEGECGACTVLIDGKAVNSCIYPAVNVQGKSVVTIEGLSGAKSNGDLDPVQEALIAHGAIQCGFCTPGMVMSIKSYLMQCSERQVIPSRDEICLALAGNLCRCTGYVKIVDAVESLLGESL